MKDQGNNPIGVRLEKVCQSSGLKRERVTGVEGKARLVLGASVGSRYRRSSQWTAVVGREQ